MLSLSWASGTFYTEQVACKDSAKRCFKKYCKGFLICTVFLKSINQQVHTWKLS